VISNDTTKNYKLTGPVNQASDKNVSFHLSAFYKVIYLTFLISFSKILNLNQIKK